MSTTLKINYLKALSRIGKKSLIAKSVFGYPYRISLGDTFSENPFYNASSNVGEIVATAAWVLKKDRPVVFDIGAHCGFIATQLAAILKSQSPSIFSFEPVAPTFTDLVSSINDLSLNSSIHPIPVALSNNAEFVRLNYSKKNSMLAQIVPGDQKSNNRSGDELYYSPAQTMDEFVRFSGPPDVIKIDVEGWEINVFEGCRAFLENATAQNVGICLEWNPGALNDTGGSIDRLHQFFKNYDFYYINDYEGQVHPVAELISDPLTLLHVCNVFLIHKASPQAQEWKSNFVQLIRQYNVKVG
jgi:FkbM family methyltransferase